MSKQKKWIIAGIILFILWVIGTCAEKGKTNKSAEIEKKFNMDSLISEVKKDKSFDIKDVYYNAKDSSFNIAITNKDNVIKKHDYSAKYFNTMFYLDSVAKIEGVYLYEYKTGNSLAKNDYKVQLDGYGQRLARYIEKFSKKNLSSWDGSCRPLEKYLKKNLDDPSSLEIVNTWNNGMNKDSTFAIKTTFRAKNRFNATVLQTIYCNVDIDGYLSEIRIE